ncbi:hypothetical protein [Actinopolymorpha pittospori]
MSPRSLPARASLHQLRRQAKDLHQAAATGDPAALARFATFAKAVSLTSAHLVVAREYGYSSWARLKDEVEHRQRGDVRDGETAEPADRSWPTFGIDPPDDELGTVVAVAAIAASSPRATIAINDITVHSTGCLINLEWVLHRTTETTTEWQGMFEEVLGHPSHRLRPEETRPPGSQLILTAEFSDGRRATTATTIEKRTSDDHTPMILDRGGGVGHRVGDGDCRGRTTHYLWPLPPPGELRFVVEWPTFGVPRTTTLVDADAIHAAKARIRRCRKGAGTGPQT